MTKTLIEATPTSVRSIGRNEWMFSFGAGVIGHEVGAAYLLPGNPHYTRFKVIASPDLKDSSGAPIPVYQPVSERPLTAEEIAHFEALVNTVELYRKNS